MKAFFKICQLFFALYFWTLDLSKKFYYKQQLNNTA